MFQAWWSSAWSRTERMLERESLLPERPVGVETSGITVNRYQAMRPQSQVTIVTTRATVDSQVALVVNNPPANVGDIRGFSPAPDHPSLQLLQDSSQADLLSAAVASALK